ncbi:hypothetical protein [Phreatobacter cathodiphilus]|uniref:Uncharacterized protein n=1 Tax=Phreatobacter cathodiphilus TaxID=1868589 RepID=A0A2S0NAM8_9HYPH|nr:hypothetical protein [Phreatobacter cathodiphilus]AVO45202.1 hypothetical protein C6569_09080 [Phreatobacter cathodiphilus]
MTDPKPPFGNRERRSLPKPQLRVDAAAAATPPAQKRSVLLSPVGIGTAALLGIGTVTATNGFGLGGTRQSCSVGQVATSVAQCEALMPGPQCAAAFAGGATAVGLSRSGSGPWGIQPVRLGTGGAYQTLAGQPFSTARSCSSSSSSSSRSHFWGGGSSSAGNSSSGAASSQSQGVTRSGFGSTARSFSSSSRGG